MLFPGAHGAEIEADPDAKDRVGDCQSGMIAWGPFEGLTRHRGQRFFMVSDDNRRTLQSTLLVYFELLWL
jgi:hypothetical protein